MKASEAIEILIGIRRVSGYSKKREEALDMAISALEKQEGKKPIYRKVVYKHHEWKKDENGEIGLFALDIDYHNGPACVRCGEVFCVHCFEGQYDKKINEGPCDCSYYECPTCGKKVFSRQKLCDCGQRIDWSDEHGID